jgi:hypothetical protein
VDHTEKFGQQFETTRSIIGLICNDDHYHGYHKHTSGLDHEDVLRGK